MIISSVTCSLLLLFLQNNYGSGKTVGSFGLRS
jgi:hypothetical protein